MPIRSSGQISFSEIQTEFTGTNPISLSEYYRLGAYVPSLPVNSNLPTAGAIKLSNFYGTSQANVTFNGTVTKGTRADGRNVWKFTESASFTIYKPGWVDVLLVAGGGRGSWGYGYAGDGGGAGGLIYLQNTYLDPGTYTMVVGGAQSDTVWTRPDGYSWTAINGGDVGESGGSAGAYGAQALQPTSTPGQFGFGNLGGVGSYPSGTSWLSGGGGGGAGGAGANGTGQYAYEQFYSYYPDGSDGDAFGRGGADCVPAGVDEFGAEIFFCTRILTNPMGQGYQFTNSGGAGGIGKQYDIDIDNVPKYYAGGGGGGGGFNDNASSRYGFPFAYALFGAGGAGGLGGGGRGQTRGDGYYNGGISVENGQNLTGGGGGGGGPGSASEVRGYDGLYTQGGSGIAIIIGDPNVLHIVN